MSSLAPLRNKLELTANRTRELNQHQFRGSLTQDLHASPQTGGSTAQIRENGDKPEDWLAYTRFVKQNGDFNDPVNRHNHLCSVYDKAIQAISSEKHRNNLAYAFLLIEYANVKSEYSPDDAQSLFNYARSYGKKFSLVYVAAAQFELSQGYPARCKKILDKCELFSAQPTSLLQKAYKNFEHGKTDLLSAEELDLYLRNEVPQAGSSTSSQDSTGELSLPGRPPLATLFNNDSLGHSDFAGFNHGRELPQMRKVDTTVRFKMPKHDTPDNNDRARGQYTSGNIEDADTAPLPEAGTRTHQNPPVAPASSSKPPFRSYHSTPDIKQSKSEIKSKAAGSSKSSMWLPRRVKKLVIPVVTDEDEGSEDENNSWSDIKPLDNIHENDTKHPDNIHQTDHEMMDQSHPGHTSGYASSMSFTSHTRTCPDPGLNKYQTHIEAKPPPPEPRCPAPVQPAPLPQPQIQTHRPSSVCSQPAVVCTPSQQGRGQPMVGVQQTPSTIQSTPNMKPVEMLTVNGKSYSILRVVGRGGSSKVYQCIDFDKQQSVAIKFVDLSTADDFTVQGYKNEITLLKRLQYSDKVIKMYDYEYNQEIGCLFIVLELGDTDLASLFRNASKTKDITESLMKYYWEAMLKAVLVLHKEGIIHSDLKPANFLLVKGQLKLIDFGIANAIQQDRTSVTLDSQVGTLNYMSPEAIADSCGGMHADANGKVQPKFKIGMKSDVWSLGCILYNMVYGRTPFQHIPNQLLKLQAIINPHYNIELKAIPDQHLIDVMKTCLVRDPKQRPSIDDLLQHPYLTQAKESPSVPSSMQSLLAKLQKAVANSPNSMRKLEDVLEQIQAGKMTDGCEL